MIPRPFFQQSDPNYRKVGWWLMIVALMVFLMIIVGGATRLTQSGLSIVEWKPISGTIPPMSAEAWQEEFQAYQAYPEFQQLNQGMTLGEFKKIFWWEYSHRLLGRLVGLMFALPLLFFIARRMIPPEMKLRMFFLLALGAGQGLLGWYMVQSGLIDRPSVSHYRLAAHLSLAVFLLGALLWTAWQFLQARQFDAPEDRVFGPFIKGFLTLVAIQLVFGALLAGLDGGLVYNDWPLMNGTFFPDGMWTLSPVTANLFDNTATVQLIHRTIAYVIFALAFVPLYKARKLHRPACMVRLAAVLALIVILQLILGILALMMVVPVALGVLHQAFGILLFVTALYFLFSTRGPAYG